MKVTLFSLFMMLCIGSVQAQKAPNTQEKSIWAKQLKVDGKLDDWGTGLSAYNKENNLWYSMANDDQFLYLAVKKDKFPTKAYARGGIKLFISLKEVKSTNDLSAITFPVPYMNGKSIPKDEWNEIDVRNIPGIADSLISVYNEHGIQVAFNLAETDKGEVYYYELAVPLKLLGIHAGQKIFYNMLLRGARLEPLDAAQLLLMKRSTVVGSNPGVSQEMIERALDSTVWSDFWGSYKLASKP